MERNKNTESILDYALPFQHLDDDEFDVMIYEVSHSDINLLRIDYLHQYLILFYLGLTKDQPYKMTLIQIIIYMQICPLASSTVSVH